MASPQPDTTSGSTVDAAQLRKEAIEVIRRTGSAEKLSGILKKVDDPRLLDRAFSEQEIPDSLLDWAILEGRVECARLLIAAGADPMSSHHGGGFLPVHYFGMSFQHRDEPRMRELAELLASAGADFEARCDRQWAPLHYAVLRGSPVLAEILISRGVWVDPRFLNDSTLLENIIPDEGDDDRPGALEALTMVQRVASSRGLEESILSAMPAEGEPLAKPSAGMTL